jgi:PIN domain nuclease of toxin-antitoxin system
MPIVPASRSRCARPSEHSVFERRFILGNFLETQSGKLPLPQPPAQFVPQQREKHLIAPLVLDEAAVAELSGLPGLHRDPFDRRLICQAKAHGLTLASSDSLVRQYPVALL